MRITSILFTTFLAISVFSVPLVTHAAIVLDGTASDNTDNDASVVVDVSGANIDDGDLILFFGSSDGGGYDLPDGAGFTPLQDADTPGSHNNILGYKIASSEPSSYTVNVTSGSERGIVIFAVYSGIDTGDPIDDSNSNTGGSDTTGVITSITPSNDNSAVAVFIGTESGNNASPIVSAWPGSLVEQLDNVNGPPGGGDASSAGAFADVIQTTAAAVSGNISLDGGSTNWGVMAVSINPASEDGTPTVFTDIASNVGASSATLHGIITDDGGDTISEHGFAYSTVSDLSSSVSTTTLGSGTESAYTDIITGLSEDQTYYFRAYATNGNGTGYGSIKNLGTGNTTPTRAIRLFGGSSILFYSGLVKFFGQ